MVITVQPKFGGTADMGMFNIHIDGGCTDLILNPVTLNKELYQVYLWNTLEIDFDPFFADLGCGVTAFSILNL